MMALLRRQRNDSLGCSLTPEYPGPEPLWERKYVHIRQELASSQRFPSALEPRASLRMLCLQQIRDVLNHSSSKEDPFV